MLEDLSAGFIELKRDEVTETVTTWIERGDDPLEILEQARRAESIGEHTAEPEEHARHPRLRGSRSPRGAGGRYWT